jgi:Rrf2 family protein
MKLSTKGRYATRALLDLACHREEGPVPLKDIARRQEISLHYLEHIITPLVAAGLVRSLRGPLGGIQLARPPHEIRLSEIIRIVEGSIVPVDCVDNPELCSRSRLCVTRKIWAEIERVVNVVLESTTLQNLVEREKSKEEAMGLGTMETG